MLLLMWTHISEVHLMMCTYIKGIFKYVHVHQMCFSRCALKNRGVHLRIVSKLRVSTKRTACRSRSRSGGATRPVCSAHPAGQRIAHRNRSKVVRTVSCDTVFKRVVLTVSCSVCIVYPPMMRASIVTASASAPREPTRADADSERGSTQWLL